VLKDCLFLECSGSKVIKMSKIGLKYLSKYITFQHSLLTIQHTPVLHKTKFAAKLAYPRQILSSLFNVSEQHIQRNNCSYCACLKFSAPCPSLPFPENGLYFLFNNDKIASFYCNQGYALDGPPILRCRDGYWSPKPPVCVKMQ